MTFTKGKRVRVRDFHPKADMVLWGRTGVVTDVGAGELGPLRDEHGGEEPIERQYEVRFDGDDQSRSGVWESWLEPVQTPAAQTTPSP